jgi:hypothetical protein
MALHLANVLQRWLAQVLNLGGNYILLGHTRKGHLIHIRFQVQPQPLC